MSLFVDTSIWYAAADSSDASNGRAKTILAGGEALVTTVRIVFQLVYHRQFNAVTLELW